MRCPLKGVYLGNEEGVRIKGNIGRGSWEERFETSVQKPRREFRMEEVSEKEKAALLDMLKVMMVFKPGDRMTAKQVMAFGQCLDNGHLE